MGTLGCVGCITQASFLQLLSLLACVGVGGPIFTVYIAADGTPCHNILSSLPLLLACFTCSSSCSRSPETGFPSIDVREGSLPTPQDQEHLISIHPRILPRLHEAECLLFLVSPLLTTISLLPALFPSSLSLLLLFSLIILLSPELKAGRTCVGGSVSPCHWSLRPTLTNEASGLLCRAWAWVGFLNLCKHSNPGC